MSDVQHGPGETVQPGIDEAKGHSRDAVEAAAKKMVEEVLRVGKELVEKVKPAPKAQPSDTSKSS